MFYEVVNWLGRGQAWTRVVASLSHHADIASGHVTGPATPAVQVLLEFVVEHIREPSGGKSCAG